MAKKSVKFDLPYNMTLTQLLAEVRGVPGQALVSTHTMKGDRPWESNVTSMTVTWDEPARPGGVL